MAASSINSLYTKLSELTVSTPYKRVRVKLSKNKNVFALIGEICAEWAAFEVRLDTIIWLLSRIDYKISAAITCQINGPVPRLRVILSILELKSVDQSLLDSVLKFMSKTHGIADIRNRLVHDSWWLEGEKREVNQRRIGRIGKRFVYEHVPVSIDQLKADLQTIKDHHMSLTQLQEAIANDPTQPFGYKP